MAARSSFAVLCCSMIPMFAQAQSQSDTTAATDLLSVYRVALANDLQFMSAHVQSLTQHEELVQGRADLLSQVDDTWSSTRVIFD